MSTNNETTKVSNINGRIRIKRDDDIIYDDARSRRDYIVTMRFEGRELIASLGCAIGEGAVEGIELTSSEYAFLQRFELAYADLPINNPPYTCKGS